MQNRLTSIKQPDTFICHASEDKGAIARPIHKALTKLGIHSWLDESEIRLGQSIRQKIDEGLANCRSATVILSRSFFSKNWTQYEMDGIVGRLMQGEILLFPIQHGITIKEISDHSPSLAGLSLWNSNEYSPTQIATEIAGQLGTSTQAPVDPPGYPRSQSDDTPAAPTEVRSFGKFYIAPAGTPELPPNTEPMVDALLFLSNPREIKGWTPVLESNEELEYVVEGETLRIRLSWGNSSGSSWSGAEFLTAQMLAGNDPFALIIRGAGGPQLHLPSVINHSPSSLFSGPSNRSGWMTFQI